MNALAKNQQYTYTSNFIHKSRPYCHEREQKLPSYYINVPAYKKAREVTLQQNWERVPPPAHSPLIYFGHVNII